MRQVRGLRLPKVLMGQVTVVAADGVAVVDGAKVPRQLKQTAQLKINLIAQ